MYNQESLSLHDILEEFNKKKTSYRERIKNKFGPPPSRKNLKIRY